MVKDTTKAKEYSRQPAEGVETRHILNYEMEQHPHPQKLSDHAGRGLVRKVTKPPVTSLEDFQALAAKIEQTVHLAMLTKTNQP